MQLDDDILQEQERKISIIADSLGFDSPGLRIRSVPALSEAVRAVWL